MRDFCRKREKIRKVEDENRATLGDSCREVLRTIKCMTQSKITLLKKEKKRLQHFVVTKDLLYLDGLIISNSRDVLRGMMPRRGARCTHKNVVWCSRKVDVTHETERKTRLAHEQHKQTKIIVLQLQLSLCFWLLLLPLTRSSIIYDE